MILDRYKNAPLDIKLIGLLTLLISTTMYVLHLESMRDVYEQIIPIVGWSAASTYTGILIVIIFHIGFSKQNKNVFYVRIFILAFLTLGLIFGIHDTMSVTQELGESTNPYLTHSKYRWLFMIALPVILFLYIGLNALKDFKK